MKVALIGCGGIGLAHSYAYKLMEDVKVAFVVDAIKENADRFAEIHDAKAYYSVEDLLENEKPDMVDICVPSYLHKEVAMKCIDKKINTLCEKPIANNYEDAVLMVEAAEKQGIYFMIAQVIRFWPEYVYLKKAYDENIYGKLRRVYFHRMCQAPIWGSGWYLDQKQSGLAPFELHIHDADYVHYLLGYPNAVKSKGFEDKSNNNSYINTQFIYQNNDVIAEAEGGWYGSPLPFAMTFKAIFDKAVLDYKDNELTIYPMEGEIFKFDVAKTEEVGSEINLKDAGGMYNEIRYFIDCIRNNTPIEIVTPRDSLKSLHMLLMEIESAKTGQQKDL